MTDPRRTRRLSAEMITALPAVIIGIGAIGVSLYETTLVRQQLKGSVWPYVEGGYTFSEEGFRYFLTNSGVGPTRIRHAEVTVHDDCWDRTMAEEPVRVPACAERPDRQFRN